MRVLLANDDGIRAPGIEALAQRFSRDHEVYVVAPNVNKSAASCAMTVALPLSFERYESPSLPCKAAYALGGTPVDCTLAGVGVDLIPQIDVVVSGINNGPNVGTDIVYSGTCGAARQAAILGIPGIALSIDTTGWRDPADTSENMYYEPLADFACNNLERLIKLCGERRQHGHRFVYDCFVNINAPMMPKYRGAKFCSPCIRRYWDKITLGRDENGAMTSTCGGEYQVFTFGDESIDAKATGSGYVAISAVYCEPAALDLRGDAEGFLV